MPCLCTTSPLKLFVRSIAQVDVVAVRTSQRYLRRTEVRNFTSIQTFRQQQETFHVSKPAAAQQAPLKASDSQDQIVHAEGTISHVLHTPDAIAEISLESIDAIAAESISRNPVQESAVEEGSQIPIRKKGLREPKELSRTTIRRTKVKNTSFALHFSSPRAAPNDHTTTVPAPGVDVRTESKSNTNSPPSREREWATGKDEWEPSPREHWQIDKAALKDKFPDGWNPRKRLSPDALAGIRALHAQMPEVYTTSALAENFKISPDAIRRILKSKWSPNADEESDRQRRWFDRGKKIYTEFAEKGGKPPKPWRELGIGNGKPEWLLRKQRPRAPLPALITTARKLEQRRREREEAESNSLADRIL